MKPIGQVRQGHGEKEILKEFVGNKKGSIAQFKRQLSQHKETEKVFQIQLQSKSWRRMQLK